jgi:hypothetical protein
VEERDDAPPWWTRWEERDGRASRVEASIVREEVVCLHVEEERGSVESVLCECQGMTRLLQGCRSTARGREPRAVVLESLTSSRVTHCSQYQPSQLGCVHYHTHAAQGPSQSASTLINCFDKRFVKWGTDR